MQSWPSAHDSLGHSLVLKSIFTEYTWSTLIGSAKRISSLPIHSVKLAILLKNLLLKIEPPRKSHSICCIWLAAEG